jgi:putative phage-type endonuclease
MDSTPFPFDHDLANLRRLLKGEQEREQAEDSKESSPPSESPTVDGDATAREIFGFSCDWVFGDSRGLPKNVSIGSKMVPRTGRHQPSVSTITRAMQVHHLRHMRMSGPDEVRRIASMPQRSKGWFASRTHRFTGSKAGSGAGLNPYESIDAFLLSLLWPRATFQNAAMRNGTLMEPMAAKSFLRQIRRQTQDFSAQLAIPGLVVSEKEPMLAYSPDGVVMFADGSKHLIEIKTPYSRKPYPAVPKMYDCQMQLGMHLLNLDSCFFVVYCGLGEEGKDDDTHIQAIPRNREFTEGTLLPALRTLFFRRYIPLLVCRDLGMLLEGQLHLPHGVGVEYLDVSIWDELNRERP